MTEEVKEAVVQSDQIEPVTDSVNPVETNVETDTKSDKMTTPNFEVRDGKMYYDGVRVYTRDDTNKIAANAKREAEQRILQDLNVDSIDAVKTVVQTLQETTPTSNEDGPGLNVNALRDAVKKREATVDELTAEVNRLRTDLLLKDHMSQLNNAMPGNWNADQKGAVIDLMKARNMLAVEGNTFAIKLGDNYLTTDGETPDYASAVEAVGKTLGLPFGKKGVDLQYGENISDKSEGGVKPLDEKKLSNDPEYRAAYTKLRQYQPTLSRADISHNMVMKQVDKARKGFIK